MQTASFYNVSYEKSSKAVQLYVTVAWAIVSLIII